VLGRCGGTCTIRGGGGLLDWAGGVSAGLTRFKLETLALVDAESDYG
jgi:hypothetical protein